MRYILSVVCCVLFFGVYSTSWGRTLYVTDSLQITMRALPENKAKIIRMLSSGDSLELLEKNDNGWLLVRNGQKEGWVLERFTSEQLPKSMQLTRLEKKYAVLVKKSEDLPGLIAENEKLRLSCEQAEKKAKQLKIRYEELRRDAADTVILQAELERLKKENKEMGAAFEKVKMEYSLLESEAMLLWFIAGAGVFFLAWSIGFILGRMQRKKKPRLY